MLWRSLSGTLSPTPVLAHDLRNLHIPTALDAAIRFEGATVHIRAILLKQ